MNDVQETARESMVKAVDLLNEHSWATVVHYMDDEKREQVHAMYAPCSEVEFLQCYVELDPDFQIN